MEKKEEMKREMMGMEIKEIPLRKERDFREDEIIHDDFLRRIFVYQHAGYDVRLAAQYLGQLEDLIKEGLLVKNMTEAYKFVKILLLMRGEPLERVTALYRLIDSGLDELLNAGERLADA